MKGKNTNQFMLFKKLFFDLFFLPQTFDKKSLEKLHLLRESKGTYYFLPYKNKSVRNALWSLKFRREKAVASYFAELLADYLPELLAEQIQMNNFSDPLFAYVPVSKRTLSERGFDHNKLVFNHLSKNLIFSNVYFYPDIVVKTKHTKRQSRTKNRAERLQNQSGAFKLNKKYKSIIKNRNIILFDDVITTGATMDEAEKVLKTAGANKILRITITH